MRSYVRYVFSLLLLFFAMMVHAQHNNDNRIDLSGKWRFAIDSLDRGITGKWFSRKLGDQVILPGSMTTNGKGNEVDLHTPWTGGIADSSWFKKAEYAPYRVAGNIKIPFWLQPVKYYKGAAWYQKTVTIPVSWSGKEVELFIERSHWETTVWIDGKEAGMQNSLGTPHSWVLSGILTPGTHQLTIRVDNRVKTFNVGENSHSISDHTQSNWNGMTGRLQLVARPRVFIDDIQLFPDIDKKEVVVKTVLVNAGGKSTAVTLEALAVTTNAGAEKLKQLTKRVTVSGDTTRLELVYPMGQRPLLWDEFAPHLYTMQLALRTPSGKDVRHVNFGMRAFEVKGTRFAINGRTTFLRGTLECAIFPLTGYPPTDKASWLRILKKARSFGLNHIRFHSWTPPEAAFDAADELGFYLQVECSSWANQDSRIGSGDPLDTWIYEESNRVVKSYGNHPSFVMMVYGNEPGGPGMKHYLVNFVKYWQQKDPRRLYTTGAGWPVAPESDYNSTPDPRVQGWGQGLQSVINGQPPRTDYDWASVISPWKQPTVSHEIGQWCVYPDLKEIKKYTGVLKAKNFEIFREQLAKNGMLHLADSFLLASGKLQTLCYKADIEAALRTPGFAGFQLLDLHDFPGQGTALVGVLNPFWEEKGYVTGAEYSRFCNAVVPLARFPKMIYRNNETLNVPVALAQFGPGILNGSRIKWTIAGEAGSILFEGDFKTTAIPAGSTVQLGTITQALASVLTPSRLIVTVSAGSYRNSWDIFVYPSVLPAAPADVHITQQLDAAAIGVLQNGGKVLLSLKKGTLKDAAGGNIAVGFSSIFWNTAWTHNQPPHTLGILCDPRHPALKEFPTQYYSNWQWWDAMSHSNAIIMDSISKGLKPIVRVIDDWVTARPLGLITECTIGKGKLLISGIDLLTGSEKRPEARQLLHSLLSYMDSNRFDPVTAVAATKITALLKE
ncbi:sugar-binding domain-containing protein [Niabella drilacis]|uniref:Glycosyl hydrolases family 2, TIM barrel domain n=1 Tax=Niabella drilacis (strain DSM 25811 / CCM 8410 / CCUG 62505 / LMG 26954 / E90) TaxID=1285928 RepID=A0A1G6X0U0_NIADE|nr:sugar-binding domain-containing protein [Niabella drilacis]SDD71840.1 Glycosyl hydrolases family 2, TIM barrel domain [Niabella drilacis]